MKRENLFRRTMCFELLRFHIPSYKATTLFATPFAALFTVGYSYVAAKVIAEQTRSRRSVAPALPAVHRESSADPTEIARAA